MIVSSVRLATCSPSLNMTMNMTMNMRACEHDDEHAHEQITIMIGIMIVSSVRLANMFTVTEHDDEHAVLVNMSKITICYDHHAQCKFALRHVALGACAYDV